MYRAGVRTRNTRGSRLKHAKEISWRDPEDTLAHDATFGPFDAICKVRSMRVTNSNLA